MLTEHRTEQERWARGMRGRRNLTWALGSFIVGLAPWESDEQLQEIIQRLAPKFLKPADN
jgi:hypothetical protein